MRCEGAGPVLRSRAGVVFSLLLAVVGCSCSRAAQVQPPPAGMFPPQRAMESGKYAEFLAENERALARCKGGTGCDTALFNLGFVYAYAPSPYYNPARALQYFSELGKTYPQSPWTYQGRAWIALLNENLTLEERERELQGNLRTREATIRSLRAQLNRSRDIDVEMEKRERELLR
ncbi:MAG TPA: hypothetical protein VKJ47_02435 [Candidatus Binatia bacterium]|nr:hypothetical protein [Candidatus Binatia bacterium]